MPEHVRGSAGGGNGPQSRSWMGLRPELAVEFILLATSTATFQATRLGSGLFAAATLPPQAYSTWGILLTVLNYSVYANLGLLSGANREIPILVGAGKVAESDLVEQTAYGGTLIAGTVAGAVGLVAATLLGVGGLIGVVLAAALIAQQAYLFCQVALRSRVRFNEASVQQFVLALVFPVIAVSLLHPLGIAALVVGQLASYIAGTGIVLLGWRRELRPRLDFGILRATTSIGLPIMAGGLVFALLTTADRWLVLALLGTAELGKYTVASLLSSGMLLASQVVAQQFYPRMAMRYGERGSDAGLMSMAIRQGGAVLLLLAPVVVALVTLGPWAINHWLPHYATSVPALLILVPAYVLLLAGTGFWNLLIVIGRADVYLRYQLMAIGIEAALAWGLVRLGLGLNGVALAALAVFALMTLGGFISSLRLSR